MDIGLLKKQYSKLTQRQKQAIVFMRGKHCVHRRVYRKAASDDGILVGSFRLAKIPLT